MKNIFILTEKKLISDILPLNGGIFYPDSTVKLLKYVK